jgi:hypothetical protein
MSQRPTIKHIEIISPRKLQFAVVGNHSSNDSDVIRFAPRSGTATADNRHANRAMQSFKRGAAEDAYLMRL